MAQVHFYSRVCENPFRSVHASDKECKRIAHQAIDNNTGGPVVFIPSAMVAESVKVLRSTQLLINDIGCGND